MLNVMLALVVVALVLAGCGGTTTVTPGADPGGEGQLRGHTFVSTSVTVDGRPHPLADGTRITLRFTDDGRLIADAGCNSMQGPVKLGGGTIAVHDLATTEMGCDKPRMDQDRWLAELLGSRPTWRLAAEHRLVVTSGRTKLVLLDRKVAQPDRPLAKTRWVLTTILDGETASTSVGIEKAYLVFDGGKVTGSDGCNQLSGSARVSGRTIEFGPIVTTKIACREDAAHIEQAVLAVLQGTVSYAIDSDQLRLDHPRGKGIVLTAHG
jgi:heat shock protein HslJ